ncbi:MAG: CRISPR-associated endonuclease Cas1 [Myxococcales bacterium]|nr:CRISPR-associated endonuclease Cas1 [Myxococcales bacterium]
MATPESHRGRSLAAEQGVVTGDMVAQQAYCERRLHLMYVEGRWGDNAATAEGAWVHRRVDSGDGAVPEGEDTRSDAPAVVRTVDLESPSLRVRARLDLVELSADGHVAVPIEYKRGSAPEPPLHTWPPERVQAGLQALLLRHNGYECTSAVVYYAASKRRVLVPVDDALLAEVEHAVERARAVLALAAPPPPLRDSPKCPGCSLVGICLPDETNALLDRAAGPSDQASDDATPLRRLVPARDDALPLYVQEQGAKVGKQGDSLVVRRKKEILAKVRLIDVSQLVLCGSVSVTPAAINLLCNAEIPTVHLSMGHWFYGTTRGIGLRNAFDRAAQFERAGNAAFCLRFASACVRGKATNQRTLLRRNGTSGAAVLGDLRRAIDAIDDAADVDTLRGLEGQAAALYFGSFQDMLHPPDDGEANGTMPRFDFDGRNRRPPRDPVNALLSFGYALLAKEATVALLAAGLDPYWGLYHVPRHGRPALALDLMEEFRALIVDSAVIRAINTGAVDRRSFVVGGAGCALTSAGRKAFLRTYEARMDQLVTHPVFDYRLSWRRVIAVQAIMLARVLRGSLPEYIPIVTR